MRDRDALTGRFTRSKSIAETVASVGATKNTEATSVVGRSALYKALSPRQAYENNIHARKAVMAICENQVKSARRLFSRRTNEEVLDGEAYHFVRHQVNGEFVRSLLSWWNVEGEMAVYKIGGLPNIAPQRLLVLDPAYLMPSPYNARSLAEVTAWQYQDGRTTPGLPGTLVIPAADLMFLKNWNPNNPLRGASLAITGAQEISMNYYSNRFNSAFFQNGAHRDLVIRFPKNTNKAQAEDWVNRWKQMHSIYEGNAFTVAAVIGEDMEMIEPGNNARDGQFLQLRTANAEDIAGLWGVPASVMGFYSKTRGVFEMIHAELEAFFEQTLLPQMTMFSEYVQSQLIDIHFPRGSTNARKEKTHLGPHMRKSLERAYDEHPESDLVFVLDPDSLPIMSRLRVKQLEVAERYQRTMKVSPKASAEWVGIDRESNEADDLIFVPTAERVINQPTPEPQQPAVDPEVVATLNAKIQTLEQHIREHAEETRVLTPEDRETLERLDEFYRSFRKLVLGQLSDGNLFAKAEMDKLLVEHGVVVTDALRVQLAKDHLAIRQIQRTADVPDRLRAAKDYLNNIMKPSHLRRYVGAHN